jgi:hypothetical protein
MEKKDKKGFEINKVEGGYDVVFSNRTIKADEGLEIILGNVTLFYEVPEGTPEWLIKSSANMTFIRFQDASRRDLDVNEIRELNGYRFPADQFWNARARKTRGPVSIDKQIDKMSDDDLERMLRTNPKIQALWAKINEASE